MLTFLRSPLWWCVKFILKYKKLSRSLEPHFNFDFILWNQDMLKSNHSFESMHCHSITCHSKKSYLLSKGFRYYYKKAEKILWNSKKNSFTWYFQLIVQLRNSWWIYSFDICIGDIVYQTVSHSPTFADTQNTFLLFCWVMSHEFSFELTTINHHQGYASACNQLGYSDEN